MRPAMGLRCEDVWCWLWYVRNWSAERDSALKAFTHSLGYTA